MTPTRELSGNSNGMLTVQHCRVSFESHPRAAMIYVAGMLGDAAAERIEELLRALPTDLRALRVDLRAVDLIDPTAFARLARLLRRWREMRLAKVALQFPIRSSCGRETAPTALLDQPNKIGTPVSTAMIWPMSTSPG